MAQDPRWRDEDRIHLRDMAVEVPLVEVEHERIMHVVEQPVALIEPRCGQFLQLLPYTPERDIREPERNGLLGLIAVSHLMPRRVPAEHLVESADVTKLRAQVLLLMRQLLNPALPREDLREQPLGDREHLRRDALPRDHADALALGALARGGGAGAGYATGAVARQACPRRKVLHVPFVQAAGLEPVADAEDAMLRLVVAHVFVFDDLLQRFEFRAEGLVVLAHE